MTITPGDRIYQKHQFCPVAKIDTICLYCAAEAVKEAVEEAIAAERAELDRLRTLVAATGRGTAGTVSEGALTPHKSKRGGEGKKP